MTECMTAIQQQNGNGMAVMWKQNFIHCKNGLLNAPSIYTSAYSLQTADNVQLDSFRNVLIFNFVDLIMSLIMVEFVCCYTQCGQQQLGSLVKQVKRRFHFQRHGWWSVVCGDSSQRMVYTKTLLWTLWVVAKHDKNYTFKSVL